MNSGTSPPAPRELVRVERNFNYVLVLLVFYSAYDRSVKVTILVGDEYTMCVTEKNMVSSPTKLVRNVWW